MSELNNIWLNMTNDDIGFYIDENSEQIPSKRGIYAWFYPLWLNFHNQEEATDEQKQNNLRDQIRLIRKVHSYDPNKKDLAAFEKEYEFKWDPLNVTVEKDPDNIALTENDEKIWSELGNKGKEIKFNTKKYALLGTLLSRPLYVGLSNNLKSRYYNHVNGYGDGNDFNNRITEYFEKINIDCTVKKLLFVCIPFEDYNTSNVNLEKIWRKQQTVIENILKVIAQPMFSQK